MANTLSGHGFKPLRRSDGAALAGSINPYRILSSYNTSIFMYDLVTLDTNGTITQCTSTGLPVGIFMGVTYTNSAGVTVKSPYWPASTALLSASTVEAMVCDDYNVLVEAQMDGASAVLQSAVGAMFDVTVGTGSTATGLSGSTILTSSLATTLKSFRFLRFSSRPDNDPASANPYGEFAFGKHQLKLTDGV